MARITDYDIAVTAWLGGDVDDRGNIVEPVEIPQCQYPYCKNKATIWWHGVGEINDENPTSGALWLCDDCTWTVCGGMLLDLIHGGVSEKELAEKLHERLVKNIQLRQGGVQ